MSENTHPAGGSARGLRTALLRSLKIALLIFGLAVATLAGVAWLGGEQAVIPFQYDGFD